MHNNPNPLPSVERINELFEYDDGVLVRKTNGYRIGI